MPIPLNRNLSSGLALTLPLLPFLGLGTACSASTELVDLDLGQVSQAETNLDSDPDFEVGNSVTTKRLRVRNRAQPNDEGYIADVSASGTGCPSPDSWSADVAPDGQAFTVVFNQYQIELSPGTGRAKKVCRIVLHLNSNRRRGFAMGNFSFAGYAYLEENMTASTEASYKFKNRGDTPGQDNGRVLSPLSFAGPYDNEYVLQSTVTSDMFPPGHRCDKERALVIKTRLNMRNSPRKAGTGYLNTLSADGTVSPHQGVLNFRIVNKDCDRTRP